MAIPNNFRSALHGFNREDVVQYLEYINNKHQNLMNQLNEELSKLRERPDGVPEEELTAARERCGELEQQLSELNGQLEQAQLRENELNEQLEQAQQKENELNVQLEQARLRENELNGQLREAALNQEKSSRAAPADDAREDLEVFRLSARSERSAREQAELVYHQANGVLNEATARVAAVSDDLTAAADRAMAQITQLQMAVSRSKQTLQDAASIMQAIRPNRN